MAEIAKSFAFYTMMAKWQEKSSKQKWQKWLKYFGYFLPFPPLQSYVYS